MILMFFREFFHQGKKTRFLSVLKSLATVSILVTFLIFHFILAPHIDSSMINTTAGLGNILVHYITPLWFFMDYLLFDRKGSTRLSDPFRYTVFPIYYFVFANFRAIDGELYDYGSTISQFPYPFLDYSVFGIYGVSAAVIVITIAVLIIGFMFVGIDQIMKIPRARFQTQTYGNISQKPYVKLKYRFFKSKASKLAPVIEDTGEVVPEDLINDLDFLDADRFE